MADNTVKKVLDYIEWLLSDTNFDPPHSIYKHFLHIKQICELGAVPEPVNTTNPLVTPEVEPGYYIVAACDGSVNANPGVIGAVGFAVTRFTNANTILGSVEVNGFAIPATTNNQAEFSAVYEALQYLLSIYPSVYGYANLKPGVIEIQTDSQLVVKQVSGEFQCNEPKLKNRLDSILDIVPKVEQKFGAKVVFSWRPRCSTPLLKEANRLAQQAIGVPNH